MTNTLSDPSNNCQHETETHEDDSCLFAVLPAEIIYDIKVSPEALRTYAVIAGFFKKSGYAFASNIWIAGKLKLHERRIQEHLNCLEENGYIIRETFNDGFRKKRRIWHPDAWAKKNSKNVAQTDVNSRIDTDVNVCSDTGVNSRYNNISNTNNIRNNIIGPKSVHNLPPPKEAPRSANAPLSADASDVLEYFIKKIKEKKPSFKEPNRKKWGQEIERMLRIDKRDAAKTKQLIDFIVEGKSFPYIQSAEKLREKYDQQEAFFDQEQQNQKLEPNKKLFYATRAKFPDRFKSIRVTKNGILNEFTGKDADWSLPEKTFGQILAGMIGGSFST